MKKFAKILICLLLTCTFVLSGCSLVQRNTERYLNKTVATAGTSIEISMQDLLTAYNSYGYQYVNLYGYTKEKAVNKVLDELINREIVLEEAKKHILVDNTTNMVYYLTFDNEGNEINRRVIFNKNVWQNDLLEEVYNTMNEHIANFEKTVRKELGLEEETSNEETEEKNTFSPYKPFEKTVKYEDGEWSVIYDEIEPEEKLIGGFVQAETGNKQVSEIAYKRYLKSLVANQKTLGKTMTQEQAMQEEINRLYEIYEGNKYLDVFQQQYEKEVKITQDFNLDIVNYYKALVAGSYAKYDELGNEAYKQYCEDMQSDASTVYYHHENNKFVNVSHVLIKLSDEQLEQISELDKKLSTGVISQKQRDDEYQNILNKTVVHARDEDGKETEVTKTVEQVYAEIEGELAKYNTLEEKAIAFNKFIYKYGQDTGVINASNYYVVNLDTEIEDKMVKNFADKSRELYAQNNQGGNLSTPVFVESSNYSGYHIIFNVGGVKNDFEYDQLSNVTAEYLYNKKIMLGTDKTLYDLVFEKLTRTNYTDYEQSIINTTKHNVQIVIYNTALENLY